MHLVAQKTHVFKRLWGPNAIPILGSHEPNVYTVCIYILAYRPTGSCDIQDLLKPQERSLGSLIRAPCTGPLDRFHVVCWKCGLHSLCIRTSSDCAWTHQLRGSPIMNRTRSSYSGLGFRVVNGTCCLPPFPLKQPHLKNA